eukprot:TRINITY_DN45506_c0_g1_i3.p1 TRINITY_DN45506_c0_g1~~TRINITY_DN45506_c0_g1_i3.p1  ORF type:complete len:187 (-),score=39.55 TRINITY_DN45506_c0_g1_i3:25-522(-)
MLRSLVGSEMCIRDRYQRRVRGKKPRLNHAVELCCEEARFSISAEALPLHAQSGSQRPESFWAGVGSHARVRRSVSVWHHPLHELSNGRAAHGESVRSTRCVGHVQVCRHHGGAQPSQVGAGSPSGRRHLQGVLGCADLSLIHISEPTRLLSISYAVFCLKKKKT